MYSSRGQLMYSYMPWYYAKSAIMQAILDSQGVELDEAREALESSLKQFFTVTADWGLDRWEKELAITPPSDATTELRRALIQAKLLATEIMTPAKIQEIINCFVPSKSATVVEIPGTYKFRVEVPFDDAVYIDALQSELQKNKPAHLAAPVDYVADFVDTYPDSAIGDWNFSVEMSLPLVERWPWRGRTFDGSWHFTKPVVYDGTWKLSGTNYHDGEITGNEDAVSPATRFDGLWQFDGSKTFAMAAATHKVLFDAEEPETLADKYIVSQADSYQAVLLYDSETKFDGSWNFTARRCPYEAESTDITIGRRFNGKWFFDGGNTLYYDGSWKFDGSRPHDIFGDSPNHYNGTWKFDGTAVFWKGGEYFANYRYTSN